MDHADDFSALGGLASFSTRLSFQWPGKEKFLDPRWRVAISRYICSHGLMFSDIVNCVHETITTRSLIRSVLKQGLRFTLRNCRLKYRKTLLIKGPGHCLQVHLVFFPCAPKPYWYPLNCSSPLIILSDSAHILQRPVGILRLFKLCPPFPASSMHVATAKRQQKQQPKRQNARHASLLNVMCTQNKYIHASLKRSSRVHNI